MDQKISYIVMYLTYIFQQGKFKLHANQHDILLEKWLNVVSPYFTTRLYNLSDIVQKSIFTTLSSQYKVKIKDNCRKWV